MKKLVCGCFGHIYYATILKDGIMSPKGRVDVTDDAIDAVMNNIMTLDGFDKDSTAGYEVKAKDGRTFILSLYDKDKYKLVSKDKR